MVAHRVAQILQRHLLVGDDPKGHLLGILFDTGGVRHILGEVVAETVEETPDTGFAVAATGEVGHSIGGIIREIDILAFIPAHRTGITHDIVGADHEVGHRLLAVHRVFLQQILHLHLHVAAIEELRDTALVGVSGNGIVGNADSHPDGASLFLRTVGATAHHLEHPSLVLIGH